MAGLAGDADAVSHDKWLEIVQRARNHYPTKKNSPNHSESCEMSERPMKHCEILES